MNNGLIKPFERLVKLVDRYGFAKLLFALMIIIALLATSTYFARQFIVNGRTDTEIVDEGIDISEEIHDLLMRILKDLKVDLIFMAELFTTSTGDQRGFSYDGSIVFSSVVITPRAPKGTFTRGFRMLLSPTVGDPKQFLATQIDRLIKDGGLYLTPDTKSFQDNHLVGFSDAFGASYYAIGGFDLSGKLIVVVNICYFTPTILTENNLRPYVDDIQKIVALITSG